jgi:hypothetical protein
MWRPIGKVPDRLLLLQAFDLIFANLMIFAHVDLTAWLEAVEKALSEEKAT